MGSNCCRSTATEDAELATRTIAMKQVMEEKSALKIQCAYRGYRDRKAFKEMKQEMEEKKINSEHYFENFQNDRVRSILNELGDFDYGQVNA